MKVPSRIVSLALFFSFAVPFFSVSQSRLADSRQDGPEVFVYRIDRQTLRAIQVRGKAPDESMLHTMVARYGAEGEVPALPRGNYLKVQPDRGQLRVEEHTVDDLRFRVVEDEQFRLFLYDSLGRVIDDAQVRCGMKRLRFDRKTQAYATRRVDNGAVVEIGHDGVWHYLETERKVPYRYKASAKKSKPLKRARQQVESRSRKRVNPGGNTRMNGFIVFSKPKYKPGETVRIKAYLATQKGRPYNRPVYLSLLNYHPQYDSTLVRLEPYRPGMYEYSFRLTNSLRLTLDKDYRVVLKSDEKQPDDRKQLRVSMFRYEEYELKRIRFALETDRRNYFPGDTIRLDLRATDENEMPVYDGRVTVTVTPTGSNGWSFYGRDVYVPDVLWEYKTTMGESANWAIVIPDSILPRDVALDLSVKAVFLNAENEKQTDYRQIRWDPAPRKIDFAVEMGMMTVRELAGGRSESGEATLTLYDAEDRVVSRETVLLPHTFAVPWRAATCRVETGGLDVRHKLDEDRGHPFDVMVHRGNDTVRIEVDNPAGVPFWYTIRRGSRDIARGYASDLRFAERDRTKEGYSVRFSYVYGGKSRSFMRGAPYKDQDISLDIATPKTVAPGQTAPVEVTVTDRRGRGVRNTDVTAYAFTTKFDHYSIPATTSGTYKAVRGNRPFNYTVADKPIDRRGRMTWERWRGAMGLDSIEYYRFLYPDPYYRYAEPDSGGVARISPYVVVDGRVEGIHLLWIDGEPRYFEQAQHEQVYSFPVSPGLHTIRMRTHDREATVSRVRVEEGMKTVLSVDGTRRAADSGEIGIEVKELKRVKDRQLSEEETARLTRSMISVAPNFGSRMWPGGEMRDLPAYLVSGGVCYYLNPAPKQEKRLRRQYRTPVTNPVLTGPFPHAWTPVTYYLDTMLVARFAPEGGCTYSLLPGYQKLSEWSIDPIVRSFYPYEQQPDFRLSPTTPASIRERQDTALFSYLKSRGGLFPFGVQPRWSQAEGPRLKLDLGRMADGDRPVEPVVIAVRYTHPVDADPHEFIGGERLLRSLLPGKAVLTLVFSDTTGYTVPVTLRKSGFHYLSIDSVRVSPPDDFTRDVLARITRYTLKNIPDGPWRSGNSKERGIVPAIQLGFYDASNAVKGIVTGTVQGEGGMPLTEATVFLRGTTLEAMTDRQGQFTLPAMKTGELVIRSPGYETIVVELIPGFRYRIRMGFPRTESDDEVIVVGYGAQRIVDVMGAVTSLKSEDTLLESAELEPQERVNIQIRGNSSFTGQGEPLYIVDGVPSTMDMTSIEPSQIASMRILKGDEARAMYGSRGANGVVIIETKQGSLAAGDGTDFAFPPSIRRNFHDDAFWKPRITTDRQGKARFEVTYPDDITSWRSNFIAVAPRNRIDQKELTVHSFKALTAQLSVPQFAVRGDSLNAVGKLTSHLGDTIDVLRSLQTPHGTTETNIRLARVHVDTIPVSVTARDSVAIGYSLRRANGFSDGEERQIPVYERGVSETSGEFRVLADTALHTFTPDPKLGKATLHAEASGLEFFLREIDRIDRYPHMCNEQVASKLKALLLKRRICEMTGRKFRDGGKINDLIRHLNRNKNNNNLWGWWNQSNTVFWISLQVIDALIEAEAAGYKTGFDRRPTINYLIKRLDELLSPEGMEKDAKNFRAKGQRLQALDLLWKLGAEIDYPAYYRRIGPMINRSLHELLYMCDVSLRVGASPQGIRPDRLLKHADTTMMGSLFWPEPRWQQANIPDMNQTQNTLIAYRVLRTLGGHEETLAAIRNYFFETRRSGHWGNTYESSRILETILPDMLRPGESYADARLYIDGREVSAFPYTAAADPDRPVTVRKSGTFPVFFTLHQEAWIDDPEAKSEGFAVRSSFREGKDTATVLRAGEPVELDVTVTCERTGSYVMIEVPIPAGCSYESKTRGDFRKEAHREYRKERVSIYCNRLTKGEHVFTIRLIPRYTGRYHVNPARAELMYFPTFFGRNGLEVMEIGPSGGFHGSE